MWSTLASIAWRNLWRQRRRTTITALAIGIGVAACMCMLCLTDGLYATMHEVLVDQQLGHVQITHPQWPERRSLFDTLDDAEALQSALEAQPGVTGVMARVYGGALLGGAERTTGGMLIGIQPAAEARVRALDRKVFTGRWLEAPGEIVLGADLADTIEVGVGGEVVAVTQAADGSIGNELFAVVGLARTGSPAVDRGAGVVFLADAQRILAIDGKVHELTVLGASDDREVVTPLRDAIDGVVGGAHLTRPWWEVEPSAAQMFVFQDISRWVVVGIFFGVAALGVVNTLMMSVMERIRELGVMRALGVRPGELVRMVLVESVLVAVIGIAGGGAIGLLGDLWLVQVGLDLATSDGQGFQAQQIQFDPIIYGKLTPESVYTPVLGAIVCTLLAGLAPAWRVARLDPIDAIRSE